MTNPRNDAGVQTRKIAVNMLDQVLGEGRLLSEIIGAGALDALPPAERARAQRLTLQTLRALERADRVLQKHLQKKPPLRVHNALRLGTVELCQGEAAHGVVHAMVEVIANHKRYGKLKGLVNAVLRKVSQQGPEAFEQLRAPRLPKWLRAPLAQAWGNEAIAQMEIAHFAGAPLDLTPKDGNTEKLAQTLGGICLPTGSVRLSQMGQLSQMSGYDTGEWWVQDAAAAIPARLFSPLTGKNVLDLCAAPGGKTLQMAAMGAKVTAVDISQSRVSRLQENLRRCALDAEVVVADALSLEGAFDAILLDAPCSATGTMRRHPDLPHAKDGSEFGALIDLQAQIIDHAWQLLKPGAQMVFCTCSLLPDEGEVQVLEALERHPDMRINKGALDIAGVDPAWHSSEGGLRLRPDYWPDLGGMDGFYAAVLDKNHP